MSDHSPKSELKIGAMPVPRWFDAPPEVKVRNQKWVGIEAFTPGEQVKTFLFFMPLKYDLHTEVGRNQAAHAIVQNKVEFDIDVAIGPDIESFNSETGEIVVSTDSSKVGLYIESEKRYGIRFQAKKIADITKLPLEMVTQMQTQALKVIPQSAV